MTSIRDDDESPFTGLSIDTASIRGQQLSFVSFQRFPAFSCCTALSLLISERDGHPCSPEFLSVGDDHRGYIKQVQSELTDEIKHT